MKYMRWSYDELLVCPADYLEVIYELARDEVVARRRAGQRR